jgi:hypothetical protein
MRLPAARASNIIFLKLIALASGFSYGSFMDGSFMRLPSIID